MRRGFTCVAIAFVMLVCSIVCSATTVYAVDWTTIEPEWAGYRDGNLIRQGGFNEIDGVKCETENDCYALENYLDRSNYILVTSDSKEISGEDYELIKPYLPHRYYIEEEKDFLWNKYKLYLYRPSYDDAMERLEDGKEPTMTTQQELQVSSVMVNYFEFYQRSRVGVCVNEYNNMIPDWYENTGFIVINSPVSIEITFELSYERTLCCLYVKAGEPLLVKMKAGLYAIREINTIEISDNEPLLHNNLVNIQSLHTEDNPYNLDLMELIEKYEIPSMDIEDKPNCEWNGEEKPVNNTDEFPEEMVKVDKPTSEESETAFPWYIVVIILVVCVVVVVIILYIRKKKR